MPDEEGMPEAKKKRTKPRAKVGPTPSLAPKPYAMTSFQPFVQHHWICPPRSTIMHCKTNSSHTIGFCPSNLTCRISTPVFTSEAGDLVTVGDPLFGWCPQHWLRYHVGFRSVACAVASASETPTSQQRTGKNPSILRNRARKLHQHLRPLT